VKKQRIYIDTSVVGGYFDQEFQMPTRALFGRLLRREVVFVISDLLGIELSKAPDSVRILLETLPPDVFEAVRINEEAKVLAEAYIAENVVGKTSFEDCLHIALATIYEVDVLASWNFKHIVNLIRIRGYNAVNIKNGYKPIEIRNPMDLMYYESEN
jgi:predicted nucleic acid-binding protein